MKKLDDIIKRAKEKKQQRLLEEALFVKLKRTHVRNQLIVDHVKEFGSIDLDSLNRFNGD